MTEAQRLREEAEHCMRLAEAIADERRVNLFERLTPG
jgi:hypothetical protein